MTLPVALLGDRATVALMKQWKLDKLTEPENTRAYLRFARIAFSKPWKILNPDDRKPDATFRLLDDLATKDVEDPELESEIRTTRTHIQDQLELAAKL